VHDAVHDLLANHIVGRKQAYAFAIRHLPDRIRRIPDCRTSRLHNLDSPLCRGPRWPCCRVGGTLARWVRVAAGLPGGTCDPSPDRSHALVLESVRGARVLGGPVLYRRYRELCMDALRTANQARAANPAMTSLFHAERQWRGVADARRWATYRA